MKHLTVTSLDKGRFTLGLLDTIVNDAVFLTLDSRTVGDMSVSCNFKGDPGQIDLHYQKDWLYDSSEGELLTLKHAFQNFVISTMESFNYSALKSTHVLNFTTTIIGNNLAVISYGLISTTPT